MIFFRRLRIGRVVVWPRLPIAAVMWAFLLGALAAVQVPYPPLTVMLLWASLISLATVLIVYLNFLYRYLNGFLVLILGCSVLLGYGWTVRAVVETDQARLAMPETRTEVRVTVDRCWQAQWGERCLVSTADNTRWYLQWSHNSPAPVVGGHGLVTVDLRPWATTVSPGQESFGLWLLRQRVAARGQVTAYDAEPANGWQKWVMTSRAWLRDRNLSSPADGIYQALVLGDRIALDPEVRGRVTRTQTQHLLALSGLHIGTLGLWVFALAGLVWRSRPFRVRQDLQKIVALVAAGWLLAVALPAVSLWRAFLMALLPGLALLLRRRWSAHRVLLVIGTAMVLADPLIWLDLGAWFSWVATLVLVLSVRHIGHWPGWQQLVFIQLTLSLLLVPVYALWQLPIFPLGMVLNLLLIPWVTLVALPTAFLTALYVPGANTLFEYSVLVWDWLLQLFDRLWVVFPVLTPGQAMLLLGCCGLGLLVRLRTGQWALMAGIAVLLHWHNGQPPSLKSGEFDLWVLDTGQAQSLIVETAGGRVMYDTGVGDPETVNLQQPPLRWQWRWPALGQGGSWAAVIVSHNHVDHVGGLASVAWQLTPDHLYTSEPLPHAPAGWPAAGFCDQGEAFTLADVTFTFKRPVPGYRPASRNDASCVLSVRSPNGSALITGDAGKRVEYGLLQFKRLQPVDLLVSGHHGSHTSSAGAFLQALAPRWVVHSAAAWRQPERPDAGVVARIQAAGADNHCTCWSGTLQYQFRTDEIIHRAYSNRLLPWLKIGGRAHPANDRKGEL